MNVFLASTYYEDKALLDQEEAHHCFKVLRRVRGDAIQLIDGKGTFSTGSILSIDKKQCEVQIHKSWKEATREYTLQLAVAPTKNISRYEWFIEKAIEIGVDRITPILCEHSERTKLNLSRLNKIALSAVKQSLSATIPVLDEPVAVKEFMDGEFDNIQKIVAHLGETGSHLKNLVEPAKNYSIVIGPEGDFSQNELSQFKEMGWNFGILGHKRLRTETAAIVSAQIINSIHF